MKEEVAFRRTALLFWSWLLLAPALICAGIFAILKIHGWDPELGFGMLGLYQVLIASLPVWGWVGVLGAACGLSAVLPPHRAAFWKALPPTLMNLGGSTIWILSLVASHRGEWTFSSW